MRFSLVIFCKKERRNRGNGFCYRYGRILLMPIIVQCSLVVLTALLSPRLIPVSYAATNVSSQIISDTNWRVSGSPYIVIGDIIVTKGVTLRIEPGVVVKFAYGKALEIDGKLVARGTGSSYITFTSNQTNPQPGDWGGIGFGGTPATFDRSNNYIGGSIIPTTIFITRSFFSGASFFRL